MLIFQPFSSRQPLRQPPSLLKMMAQNSHPEGPDSEAQYHKISEDTPTGQQTSTHHSRPHLLVEIPLSDTTAAALTA
jgi:hypothetical protein